MDHLHPLVNNKMPSGYITDISNLVPSCGSCNGSKGNKEFETWYNHPKTIAYLKEMGLTDSDIAHRKEVLARYSSKSTSYGIGYKDVLSDKEIEEYIKRRDNINNLLREEQKWCDSIRKKIEERVK